MHTHSSATHASVFYHGVAFGPYKNLPKLSSLHNYSSPACQMVSQLMICDTFKRTGSKRVPSSLEQQHQFTMAWWGELLGRIHTSFPRSTHSSEGRAKARAALRVWNLHPLWEGRMIPNQLVSLFGKSCLERSYARDFCWICGMYRTAPVANLVPCW